MSEKTMSTKEYADTRKISPQAVCAAIKKGYRLPGVVNYMMVGHSYVLTVNIDQLKSFVRKNKPFKLHV